MNENNLNFNLYLTEKEINQIITSLDAYLNEAEVTENVDIYTEINSLISKLSNKNWI